jgi:hypothetical protein
LKIADASLAGKTIKCPKCSKPVKLPKLEDIEAETGDEEREVRGAAGNRGSQSRARTDVEDDDGDSEPRKRRRDEDEDEKPLRRSRSERDEDDDDLDGGRDDRPSRKKKKKQKAPPRKSPLPWIIAGVAVTLVVAGVAIFFLTRGGPLLRGEREIKELIKAQEKANQQPEGPKKLEAQLKVLAIMMAIEQMNITPDEQKKLLAKYKGKLDELKIGMESSWEFQNKGKEELAKKNTPAGAPKLDADPNVVIINPRAQFNAGFAASDANKKSVAADKQVNQLYLTADGKRAAVSTSLGFEGKGQIWDLADQPKKNRDVEGPIFGISPSGKLVFMNLAAPIKGGGAIVTRVIADAETSKVLYNRAPSDVFFRSQDTALMVDVQLQGFKNWDITELGGKFLKKLGTIEYPIGAVLNDKGKFAKQGREFVMGLSNKNAVKAWDTSTGAVLREVDLSIPHARTWYMFNASPDSKWVAVQADREPIKILDASTGSLVATVPSIASSASAFLPDRDVFLCSVESAKFTGGGQDGIDLIAYDIGQKKTIGIFRGHTKNIRSIAVSANGKVIATGDAEGDVLIWDREQLK